MRREARFEFFQQWSAVGIPAGLIDPAKVGQNFRGRGRRGFATGTSTSLATSYAQ